MKYWRKHRERKREHSGKQFYATLSFNAESLEERTSRLVNEFRISAVRHYLLKPRSKALGISLGLKPSVRSEPMTTDYAKIK